MSTNLTTQAKPGYLANVTAAPRGSESVELKDLIIPRLEIVQALSPVRKKTEPGYIQGIEEGDIYNTVTRENYGQSVTIVPVLFRRESLVWKDRAKGGGFRGAYATELLAKAAIAQLAPEDQSGCEIMDTAQHFALLVTDTGYQEVVISMSRTKMKVSRQLNSLVRIANVDRFAQIFELSTVPEMNPKGNFFNFKVTPKGFSPEDLYRAGETLYNSVREGRVVVEADRSEEAPTSTEY